MNLSLLNLSPYIRLIKTIRLIISHSMRESREVWSTNQESHLDPHIDQDAPTEVIATLSSLFTVIG